MTADPAITRSKFADSPGALGAVELTSAAQIIYAGADCAAATT